MLGFAIGALRLTHREFWDMTPLEFNAASDTWIKMNVSQEDQKKIKRALGDSSVNSDSPWNDADLVERAKRMMEEQG